MQFHGCERTLDEASVSARARATGPYNDATHGFAQASLRLQGFDPDPRSPTYDPRVPTEKLGSLLPITSGVGKTVLVIADVHGFHSRGIRYEGGARLTSMLNWHAWTIAPRHRPPGQTVGGTPFVWNTSSTISVYYKSSFKARLA